MYIGSFELDFNSKYILFSASILIFEPLLAWVSWLITIFLSGEPIVSLAINDMFWPFIGESLSEAFNIEYPSKYAASLGVGRLSSTFQSAAVKITSPSEVIFLTLKLESFALMLIKRVSVFALFVAVAVTVPPTLTFMVSV